MYAPDHIREYMAIRTACAVFDISPIPKYHTHGPNAVRLLDRIVTRHVSPCAVGQVLYTPWCDDGGKIMDHRILARLNEESFRLTAGAPWLCWLEDNAVGMEVEIEDVTAWGVLALQGLSHVNCSKRSLTPIDGLYLCSAATHPGGGVTGINSRNASRQV